MWKLWSVPVDYFPSNGYGLHQALYLSRCAVCVDAAMVAEIAATSAIRNRARAVTGALIAYDGWFLQVLEGSCQTLKPLFETIAADPRHAEVVLKSVQPIKKRLFPRGMKHGRAPDAAVFALDKASPDDLLSILKLSVLSAAPLAA
jgi:Sensors of blue-light using FAD